ncbi:MAG: tannase/feruloyl esterase family alpha/beta hydrolase [Gammaproteobacteria bacterium]
MNTRSLLYRAFVPLPVLFAIAACSPAANTPPSVATATPGACASLAAAKLTGVAIRESVALDVTDRPMSPPAVGVQRLKVPHCKVTGTIDGSIGFELLLPNAWNGKFLMGGGGGFVGNVQNQAQDGLSAGPTPLERGYATVGTDTGHTALLTDASWARNDPEARENFAHRAVHRTTEVSKAIAASYYKHAVDRSYFFGCSRGGGQAMVEAQRYPDDFDGIIAGAPVLDWVGAMGAFVRNQQAIFPDPTHLESPVITADNRNLLATALKNTCDAQDGVADGILDDPLSCKFDPASLPRCAAGPSAECVTDAQLAAINQVYSGLTIGGEHVYPGFPLGGENVPGNWDLWITQTNPPALGPNVPNLHYAFGTQFVKNFVFGDANWSYAGYDFADWPARTAELATLLNATDANLSRFAGHGGRLILWHGWSDPALPATRSVDYYNAVATQNPLVRLSARMFLLPGVAHCSGGLGPDRADWLTTLEQWVEKGVAPDQVVMTKNDAQGKTVMQRPACAYPLAAVYTGGGDPNVAASYTCVGPQ